LVCVAPQLFCDGKFLARGDRIALVFGHQTKGVVATGVRRILLNHLLSREVGQGPFLALPITASYGIELDESLTSRVRSCRCAQLVLDLLPPRRNFPSL